MLIGGQQPSPFAEKPQVKLTWIAKDAIEEEVVHVLECVISRHTSGQLEGYHADAKVF